MKHIIQNRLVSWRKLYKMPFLTVLIVFFVVLFGVRFYDGVETGRDYVAAQGWFDQTQSATLQPQISRAAAQQNTGELRPNTPDIRFQDDTGMDMGAGGFGFHVGDESLIYEDGISDEEIELLQSLAKRREALEQKERELRTREALLAAAERQLDAKTQELLSLRGEIEELLNLQQNEQDKRINSLVRTYENMKPKDAARIFDTLDLDVLLPVISRMSERRIAPILADMSSEKARLVTIRLAEQKKLPEIPQ